MMLLFPVPSLYTVNRLAPVILCPNEELQWLVLVQRKNQIAYYAPSFTHEVALKCFALKQKLRTVQGVGCRLQRRRRT